MRPCRSGSARSVAITTAKAAKGQLWIWAGWGGDGGESNLKLRDTSSCNPGVGLEGREGAPAPPFSLPPPPWLLGYIVASMPRRPPVSPATILSKSFITTYVKSPFFGINS